MSGISAPRCRLCLLEHWARDGCNFGPIKALPVTPKELPRLAKSLKKKKSKKKTP